MSAIDEERNAGRLLEGLENGGLSTADAVVLAEDLDPVLVYMIVSFLRAVYPASDPAAESVLERVVQLTSGSEVLLQKHKAGQQDPVTRWFEHEHAYTDYRGRGSEFLELIIDKLDS